MIIKASRWILSFSLLGYTNFGLFIYFFFLLVSLVLVFFIPLIGCCWFYLAFFIFLPLWPWTFSSFFIYQRKVCPCSKKNLRHFFWILGLNILTTTSKKNADQGMVVHKTLNAGVILSIYPLKFRHPIVCLGWDHWILSWLACLIVLVKLLTTVITFFFYSFFLSSPWILDLWLFCCSELLTGVVPYTDLRTEAQVRYVELINSFNNEH